MLSIIICSSKKRCDGKLLQNIKQTVGCEHEIIVIDNSKNDYSLPEAYNIAIGKSNYPINCFIHDDVILHTEGWGGIVLDLFDQNETFGLIGVAGSKLKTRIPSAWWNCPEAYRAANLIQHIDDQTVEHWNYGFDQREEEVVVIDGVFMVARKDPDILFNEDIGGFHNYDLAFSTEYVKKKYRVMVTERILLEHFSIGHLDKGWYKSGGRYSRLYKNELPLRTGEVPADALERQEFSNGVVLITGLSNIGLYNQAFKIWLKLILNQPFSKKHFSIFKLFFK